VEKANRGEGGVGYEKMIVTSALLSRIDSNKVIPIVRQAGTSFVPTFLKSKLYIDFSDDSEVEYSLDELLRTLLNAPLFEKPDIGTNPFKPLEDSRPDRTADGVREVMAAVSRCYDGRDKDYIFFGRLVKAVAMHRLTLDRYLGDCINQGLITRDRDVLRITQAGRDYLVAHGIIEG